MHWGREHQRGRYGLPHSLPRTECSGDCPDRLRLVVNCVNCMCRAAGRFCYAVLLSMGQKSHGTLRGAMPAAMAPGRANGLYVVVVGEGECRPFLRGRLEQPSIPSESASNGGWEIVGLHHEC